MNTNKQIVLSRIEEHLDDVLSEKMWDRLSFTDHGELDLKLSFGFLHSGLKTISIIDDNIFNGL